MDDLTLDESISTSAREGFDALLQQSLRASLVPADSSAEIVVIADVADIDARKMVVLTISSYLFRLMVMFHFTPDTPTREHFARLGRTTVAEMGEQGFIDAIAECGNLCCGIFNRELGRFFPHLGMSTPNLIDRQCAAYLQRLNCAHVRHLAIDMPEVPRLYVSLCVSAYDTLDFAVSAQEQVDTTGELELF